MIKNVIFDIGNVLVYFSYRESFASFGYDEAMVDGLPKPPSLTRHGRTLTGVI